MNQQTIISIETSNGTVNAFRLASGAAVSWLADEWEFVGQKRWALIFRTVGFRVVDDAEAVQGWRSVQELELRFEGAPGVDVRRLLLNPKPIFLADALAVWPDVGLVDMEQVPMAA